MLQHPIPSMDRGPESFANSCRGMNLPYLKHILWGKKRVTTKSNCYTIQHVQFEQPTLPVKVVPKKVPLCDRACRILKFTSTCLAGNVAHVSSKPMPLHFRVAKKKSMGSGKDISTNGPWQLSKQSHTFKHEPLSKPIVFAELPDEQRMFFEGAYHIVLYR